VALAFPCPSTQEDHAMLRHVSEYLNRQHRQAEADRAFIHDELASMVAFGRITPAEARETLHEVNRMTPAEVQSLATVYTLST
jgi:hypothetical protein